MNTQTQRTYVFDGTAMPAVADGAPERVPRVPSRRFHEGIALFAAALKREDAARMMESLAPGLTLLAQRRVHELSELTSPARQARVAAHFGTRWDASTRLRKLMADAGPALQDAIYQLLPLYHRTLFPTYQVRSGPPAEPPPALRAFAQRLVREAVS